MWNLPAAYVAARRCNIRPREAGTASTMRRIWAYWKDVMCLVAAPDTQNRLKRGRCERQVLTNVQALQPQHRVQGLPTVPLTL